jgi:formylmethanofuran dehydrogenase subunit E
MECGLCDGQLKETGRIVEIEFAKIKTKMKEMRCEKCGEVFYVIDIKDEKEYKITIRG